LVGVHKAQVSELENSITNARFEKSLECLQHWAQKLTLM